MIDTAATFRIEPCRREHGPAIAEVVRQVFAEYGFTWEADGYCADVYDPVGHYVEPGGMFWTLLEGERVIGCVGVSMHGASSELHRMYLAADRRGRGLGRLMLETAMNHARSHGCRSMRAWSDVKLADAHRLYLKAGFVQDGHRICNDPDHSPEYGFWKEPL